MDIKSKTSTSIELLARPYRIEQWDFMKKFDKQPGFRKADA
jgi:hypothetical protein